MLESGVVFSLPQLIHECDVLKTIAKPVLDQTTVWTLDQARSTLQNIQQKGSSKNLEQWSIALDQPLKTICSDGESQPDSKSKHKIHAEFSFIWELRPLSEKKGKPLTHCVVEGKASTCTRIVNDQGICLARWTTDIGAMDSPGAHFHFQLNGFENPPFPISLDVPRLPAPAMTPLLAIELAIAEIFQDRWKKHASDDNKDIRAWRNIQLPRLHSFLAWQESKLKDSVGASPWIVLKTAKPSPVLNLDEA